jgi:hypothetical protein
LNKLKLHWDPLADLRFRIVPLVTWSMNRYHGDTTQPAALLPIRTALSGWEKEWELPVGASEIGAALSMYWHLEPAAAVEFYIPLHILSMIEPLPAQRRTLRLPEMEGRAARVQRHLRSLNENGALLLARSPGAQQTRIGALDSVLVLDATSPRGPGGGAWLQFRFLGYDRWPEAVRVVEVRSIGRVPGRPRSFRFDLATGGTFETEGTGHHPAWSYWLTHRAKQPEAFDELDTRLYSEGRQMLARARV